MSLRTLFVTRIYEGSIAGEAGFAAFNDELADACRSIAAEDEAGNVWCRRTGYAGYTSYASLNDLVRRATVFDLLRRKLDKHVPAFAEGLNLDLGGSRLRLDSLWINILAPGGAHSGHIHPHSVVSGTVYIETPPGSSALKLEDPRLPMMMAAPKRRADAPQEDQTFIYLSPKAGSFYLWESFLRHEVPANQAKSERISLSFNYS